MSVQSKLKFSLDNQYRLRVLLDHPDDGTYCDGVVMHMTSDMVVMREEADLHFDGVVCIPRSRITAIKDDAANRIFNKVLLFNGQIQKLKIPAWINKCETIIDVLKQLHKRDIWPSVDLADKTDSWFYIGQLLQVEAEGFVIKHYSATGRWYRKEAIAISGLVSLTFNDSYGSKFNKFMRSKSQ